jgi:hypothetical protein
MACSVSMKRGEVGKEALTASSSFRADWPSLAPHRNKLALAAPPTSFPHTPARHVSSDPTPLRLVARIKPSVVCHDMRCFQLVAFHSHVACAPPWISILNQSISTS